MNLNNIMMTTFTIMAVDVEETTAAVSQKAVKMDFTIGLENLNKTKQNEFLVDFQIR